MSHSSTHCICMPIHLYGHTTMYVPLRQSTNDLSNGNTLCSLWGKNWIFIYNVDSLRLVQVCQRGSPFSKPGWTVWDFWWTEWYWSRFLFEWFVFPHSIILQCWIFFLVYMLLLPGQTDDNWGLKKSILFRKLGSIGWQKNPHFRRVRRIAKCDH
jgi:hypothetical protein